MSQKPGADELRIRTILRQKAVGPNAIPPKPAARPRDWLDDILDSPATPDPVPAAKPEGRPAPEPVPKPKAQAKPKTRRKKRRKPAPHPAWDASPRQSLVEAWDRVPFRMKWLAYHAAAAYLGWVVGLVDWVTYVTAWIADTGLVGPQAFLWYGAAACTLLLHRRTRRWWWPVAWLAAVPASSVVVGVLLYGTPHP